MAKDAMEIAEPIKQKISDMAGQAARVAELIHSEETFNVATVYVQQMNEECKLIDDKFEPIRKGQYDALQATYALIRELKDPFLKDAAYVADKQKRWRAAEIARREAEDRQKADEERKRLEDQKLNHAATVEKTNPKLAEAILNVPTVVPVIASEKLDTGDVTYRKRWVARVTDKISFIKMAAAKQEYLAAIKIDETELGRMATKLEGKIAMDGVDIIRDDIPSYGKRKSA